MTEYDHEYLRALRAEVALGVADPDDQKSLLDHVEKCAECRVELVQLQDLSDRLLDLSPQVEPPAGFESAVLAAIRSGPSDPVGDAPILTSGPGTVRLLLARPLLLAAAAIILAVVAVGGFAIGRGSETHHGGGSPSTHDVAEANLVNGTQPVGLAVYESGESPWVAMSFDASSVPSGDLDENGTMTVTCQLKLENAGSVVIGTFKLQDGYGYWAAPVPSTSSPVVGAELVDAGGRVIATAGWR